MFRDCSALTLLEMLLDLLNLSFVVIKGLIFKMHQGTINYFVFCFFVLQLNK